MRGGPIPQELQGEVAPAHAQNHLSAAGRLLAYPSRTQGLDGFGGVGGVGYGGFQVHPIGFGGSCRTLCTFSEGTTGSLGTRTAPAPGLCALKGYGRALCALWM